MSIVNLNEKKTIWATSFSDGDHWSLATEDAEPIEVYFYSTEAEAREAARVWIHNDNDTEAIIFRVDPIAMAKITIVQPTVDFHQLSPSSLSRHSTGVDFDKKRRKLGVDV